MRESSTVCENNAMPTGRAERNGTKRNGMAHNGMTRNKRRVNGPVVIRLAGVMATDVSLTGYENYGSSGEMEAGIQPEGGEMSWGQENPSANEPPVAQKEGSADGGNKTEIVKLDIERATAPMPQFEDASDTVYVKSSDGDSICIRSACDTGDDSDILAYASPGTGLECTGKRGRWTRIDYNGTSGYVLSGYMTIQVPETTTAPPRAYVGSGEVTLNPSWRHAEFSKVYSGAAVLYRSEATDPEGTTICVNTRRGAKGGASVKTLCHPDGTPKVTGGTAGAGATLATTMSGGMTFTNGTAEGKMMLSTAKIPKDKLLATGYDMLIIRESDDVQLGNIARTIIANSANDCYAALHQGSTTNNKGAFYMNVSSVGSYRNTGSVKSHWQQHNTPGENLMVDLEGVGARIFSSDSMAMDLAQTSFSTVPPMDIEPGDKASDHPTATLTTLADGLVTGVNQYFGQ